KKILGKDNFIVYRLSPLNYSIAATQDIIDYIKYDILLEFLHKGYVFEESDVDYLKSLPAFLKKNLLEVIKSLVHMIPEVGKDVIESFEKLNGLKDSFLLQMEEDAKSDGDLLAEFMEKMEKRPGNPYVTDIVTRIIQHVVNREDRTSILIIDDLDRLDPEHIFRILNVFSTHFGDQTSDGNINKYGFQKVILVCDFNNIRTLFHHRYGPEADFLGYIDKFYSTEVFHFDNKPAIISIIEKVFSSLYFTVSDQEQHYAQQHLLGDRILYEIVTLLIEKGFLSLRNVLKLWRKTSDVIYKEVSFSKELSSIKGYQIPIVMQLKLLVDLVGDYVQLEKAFLQFEKAEIALKGFETAFGFLVVLLSYQEHEYLTSRMPSPFYVDWNGLNLAVNFTTNGSYFGKIEIAHRIDGEGGDPPEVVDDPENPAATPARFWAAMRDALALLRQIRFIY
ncbi:MAG TPA: P-loop NTPase fold protein, partial [Puia sp.]|nr:P-loop NTPase fold protein [Puia sp.]